MLISDSPRPFIEDYTIRSCAKEEFGTVFSQWAPSLIHSEGPVFRYRETLSAEEKRKLEELERSFHSSMWTQRLLVERGGQLVGWHVGNQDGPHSYFMRNSVVLPDHRRKGLYTALLGRIMAILRERGFQVIHSRHRASNNAVLIPKLKAGFHVSGYVTDSLLGQLVELSYRTNSAWGRTFDYYTQGTRLDDELKTYLDL